ncbi:hypothetical protein F4802DRAFT_168458 [Xylaria palmicola]|nr:hypothetical protein F4802DRAFT_168458 [Xylaria palmicola]
MATVLGKRKARARTQNETPSITPEEAHARLAQIFAAELKSLLPATPTPTAPAPATGEASGSEPDSSDSDSWDGLSEDGDGEEEDNDDDEESASPGRPAVIEVVTHTDAYSTTTKTVNNKREARAWLSSRPPVASSDPAVTPGSKSKSTKPMTAEEDAPSLLKNDLALQRLLAESHLFSSAAARRGGGSGGDAAATMTTEHEGRNRHLATDLRLSALGSKTSVYAQAKMPMALRKGMRAAADARESSRRREARENGIVLERPAGAPKKKEAANGSGARRRGAPGSSRAIDAPSVGRMNGGMLTLSKRDIAGIESGGGARRGATFAKKRRR